MLFNIEYIRDGVIKAKAPWSGSEHEVRTVARNGLAIHKCDTARVVYADIGVQFCTVRRDA